MQLSEIFQKSHIFPYFRQIKGLPVTGSSEIQENMQQKKIVY